MAATSGEGEAVRLTEAGLEARLEEAPLANASAASDSSSSLGRLSRGRPTHKKNVSLCQICYQCCVSTEQQFLLQPRPRCYL
jgi:hypothetical protein